MAETRINQDRFPRDLDWNLLKVFNEIVRSGGVTRAAGLLARRQPAVSLALRRLEDRVGTVLCRRGPGGFALTDQGQLLAELCRNIDALVRHIPGDIADPAEGLRGSLRIQLISNLVNENVDETLAAFKVRCPQVQLELDVATWHEVEANLLKAEADIGVAPTRFIHPELRYELLFRELHRPYCGRRHRCFGKVYADPAELAEEDFVLTGADEPDALREYRLQHGLGRRVSGQSEHLEEVKRLVVAGVGIGFLPTGLVAPEVRRGEMWPVTPPSDEPAMEIHAITNPSGPRRRACDIFMDLLRERMHGSAAEAPAQVAALRHRCGEVAFRK